MLSNVGSWEGHQLVDIRWPAHHHLHSLHAALQQCSKRQAFHCIFSYFLVSFLGLGLVQALFLPFNSLIFVPLHIALPILEDCNAWIAFSPSTSTLALVSTTPYSTISRQSRLYDPLQQSSNHAQGEQDSHIDACIIGCTISNADHDWFENRGDLECRR